MAPRKTPPLRASFVAAQRMLCRVRDAHDPCHLHSHRHQVRCRRDTDHRERTKRNEVEHRGVQRGISSIVALLLWTDGKRMVFWSITLQKHLMSCAADPILLHNVRTALFFYRVYTSSRPVHVCSCCVCVTEFQVRGDMKIFF